ncbi:hypothetical protein OPV22_004683 [Ensete ventricosum]|uniref:Uncharacterized protein n=1 Tax=Ensete ventricosum TaxID=4639 RepID=A0AAV8Q730_ENSVE|nr:hypothetical protein OPV22_004683 [Ensete ventricosum]
MDGCFSGENDAFFGANLIEETTAIDMTMVFDAGDVVSHKSNAPNLMDAALWERSAIIEGWSDFLRRARWLGRRRRRTDSFRAASAFVFIPWFETLTDVMEIDSSVLSSIIMKHHRDV